MRLKDVSTEELRAELRRREEPAKGPPAPLPNPDFTDLVQMVMTGVTSQMAEQYEDEDFKHYVYESAMTAIYGKAIWEWHRTRGF